MRPSPPVVLLPEVHGAGGNHQLTSGVHIMAKAKAAPTSNYIGTTFQLTAEQIANIADLAAQDGSNIEDKQREVIDAGLAALTTPAV